MQGKPKRSGFTLIELLVVIAIIAVLVGLLIPAVMKVLGKRPELEARNDIQGLTQAISAFKEQFGVHAFPSRMILHETLSNYDPSVTPPTGTTVAEVVRSRQFLAKMFGRRLVATIDWDQNGTIEALPANGKVLSGEQCLVFFLGGAQSTSGGVNACLGFSVSTTNPMTVGGQRIPPFFNFKANRLRPDGNGFFIYADSYARSPGTGRPYVYLVDYGNNDYHATDSNQVIGTGTTKVKPYMSGSSRFMNQGGFQILCAGQDGLFGDSGGYTPANGTVDPYGRDDLSNFQRYILGAPQD